MLTALPTRRALRITAGSRAFLDLETGLAALLFAAALALQSAFLGNLLARAAPARGASIAERASAPPPGARIAAPADALARR